ncbi:MAG: radical SAM protein [Candidatus Obscuribacter sp.]|nr:radical SAM protein [Candidatus Obscuribacter sp.]
MFDTETRLAERFNKSKPDITVGWYFPNTYQIGMSGLGYQLVWWLFEQDPGVEVKRGFTDIEEPGLVKPDLMGFTVSWELDFINIIELLVKKDIAPLSVNRQDGDPLIFGGGPVLTANPEPFADMFDVILLGDAETSVPSLVEAYRQAKQGTEQPINRDEILYQLSQVPGLYVPSLYHVEYHQSGPIQSVKPIRDGVPEQIHKKAFKAPDGYATHTQILSSATAWSDTFLIEVVRSCPQECRFCLASYLTRPFRATSVDTMIERIDTALKYTKRVGLLGPSVTEHPVFEELARRLQERPEIELTIASVRADTLNEYTLSTLKNLGQKSVTIAIESGSEKLRQIMKKNLTQEEIYKAVELIDKAGLEGVKFYGIAGLPYEEQADLDATIDLLKTLKKNHKRLRFVFGVSSFVPKAQTPFQWHGRDRKSGNKLEYLRKNLTKIGIAVRPESHNWSDIQAVISRGDRRLSTIFMEVAADGHNLGAWKRALRKRQDDIPDLDYYAFREIPLDEVLPWEHLTDINKTTYLQKHQGEAATLAQ